jgi:hypothetical protein
MNNFKLVRIFPFRHQQGGGQPHTPVPGQLANTALVTVASQSQLHASPFRAALFAGLMHSSPPYIAATSKH